VPARSSWPIAAALVALALAPAEAQQGVRAPAPRADTAAFYAWWVSGASTTIGPGGDTALRALPAGVSSTGIGLLGLRPPPEWRTTRPPELEGDHWTPLELFERGDETLLLWLPTDTTGFMSGESMCVDNQAVLGVGPRGGWTPVRLNPFCNETYTTTEADVILYWLDGEEWPHVEIVTNGPACIPAELYRWDPRARRYVMVRKACAA
jgi:hypothetical protein